MGSNSYESHDLWIMNIAPIFFSLLFLFFGKLQKLYCNQEISLLCFSFDPLARADLTTG